MTLRDQGDVRHLPRAKCPRCEREVAVRKNGALREHREDDGALADVCIASGYSVQRVNEFIEQERQALVRASR